MAGYITTALLAGFVTTTAARQCQNLTIPIVASARNGVFDLAAPKTNIDVVNFVLDATQPGHNITAELLTGYATVSGNYSIAATYCQPDDGPGTTLQVLTHGVGFDRSYWDFPTNNYNYSYVNQALNRGYSTFAYDRLGIGESSHGDPINEIQSYLEIAALRTLTTMLRESAVPGITANFSKIAHVGHSYGSVETYGLVALDPTISDGIVLTGFSKDPNFIPEFSLGANEILANTFARLSNYVDGYIVTATVSALQADFFSPRDFDPAVLEAAFQTGQPNSIGEVLTMNGAYDAPNPYQGPVMVITGERDVPFCGGNCSATEPSIPEMVQHSFQNATYFDAVIVTGSGHGLNLEYTWPTTYSNILDFIDKHVK
ncbi:hypothetical protein PFICI_02833 [Pestalotiopsis fici W106-1]|uniref:AB hydrolase-1 domain-containing protein n=1 Tax=Pestalotiopsis fici (strain W106-1 / CGMCC3.15140) TaxID=1229662 RepID=W3XFD7_PESFW|nr:uncharacterized protein PFICI_02833 [Pestalotiopsis fici W106-1]ETS84808.1 hypothetical protein PFICI_02833 [Pestalotiopsis fici W106-1]